MLAAGVAAFGAFQILLNITLRSNGFTRNQKAVVDQTSRKPPNTGHDLFWGV